MKEGRHTPAQSAGRSSAGQGRDVRPQVAANDVGKMPKPVVQLPHHRGRGALLRGKNASGSLRAVERVLHVAGGHEAGLRQLGHRIRSVYPFHPDQGLPALPHFTTGGIQKAVAQGLQHPQPGIVRRAAPQTEQHPSAPAPEGIAQHFTRAQGRGLHRIAPPGGHQRQSADAGHLDDSRRTVGRHAVARLTLLHQRTVGSQMHQPPSPSAGQGFQHPLAPVGHGQDRHLTAGTRTLHSLGGRLARLQRGQAAFQRIYGNYNLGHTLRHSDPQK